MSPPHALPRQCMAFRLRRVFVCVRVHARVGQGILWGARTSIWAKVIGLLFIFRSVIASSCSYSHTWTSYTENNQMTGWPKCQFFTRGYRSDLVRKSNLVWWDAWEDKSFSDWFCWTLSAGFQSAAFNTIFIFFCDGQTLLDCARLWDYEKIWVVNLSKSCIMMNWH